MVTFRLVVMLINVGMELYLFDTNDVLVLARIPLAFARLVDVLAVVHDAVYRGICGSRHLDQVHAKSFGLPQRFIEVHQAELLVVRGYDPNGPASKEPVVGFELPCDGGILLFCS